MPGPHAFHNHPLLLCHPVSPHTVGRGLDPSAARRGRRPLQRWPATLPPPQAARRGRAEVSLKGKIRTILIPGKLCRKLLQYGRAQKIASGEIFLTRSGRGISRKQVWAEMKAVCRKAGVADSKVFPHNLRHLFARAFYQASRDVVKLADVLGHSSIETTRIYLLSTGAEHARQLARLGLIS